MLTNSIKKSEGLYTLDIKLNKSFREMHLMAHCLEKYKNDYMDTLSELFKLRQCVVCMSGEKKILFGPCNHLCCCEDCVKCGLKKCPLCRADVLFTTHVYMA